MMKLAASYFKSSEYEVLIEPNLNFGRADLGIYKDGKRNLYIEAGTVSISKLLINLSSMEGSDILVVLDSNHAIEFSIRYVNASDRFAQESHRKFHPLAKANNS